MREPELADRIGIAVARRQVVETSTVPPGASSRDGLSGRHFARAAVDEEQVEAAPPRLSTSLPVALGARGRLDRRRRARHAAASALSSRSTVKNGTAGSRAERIHAEPTPQPVPISATRSRPRCAASTCSSCPASGAHERSKPSAARPSASAFVERAAGVTVLHSSAWTTAPVPRPLRSRPRGEVWRVDYETRFEDAETLARRSAVCRPPSRTDFRVALVASTSRTPSARRASSSSSRGGPAPAPLDDCRRLCEFLYRNLHRVDPHRADAQTRTRRCRSSIAIFLVDADGRHPQPFTTVDGG